MDLSPIVPWITIVVGSTTSWFIGSELKLTSSDSIFIKAIILSVILGLVFTFFAALLNGICIEINMYINKGEVNMEHRFHSFFASPLFLVITLLRAYK